MGIFTRAAEEMRRPQVRGIVRAQKIAHHEFIRTVKTECIDTDDLNAGIENVGNGLR